MTGGYADLRQVHTWNTDFVQSSPFGQRYEAVADEIERALTFMKAIGADPDEFHRVDFHSSHEALLLEYEQSLTRIDSRTDDPYNVSAHFVWIGERTRQLDGAHIELLSKIKNPIGIKLGPTTTPTATTSRRCCSAARPCRTPRAPRRWSAATRRAGAPRARTSPTSSTPGASSSTAAWRSPRSAAGAAWRTSSPAPPATA